MSNRFWYYDECISPDDDNAFLPDELDCIVQTVKDSSFLDDESGFSIDERMTSLLGGVKPEWIGFQIPDGTCYVNCFGVVSSGKHSSKIELQFELSDDLERFVFSGLLIDDIAQPEKAVIEFERQFAMDGPVDDPFGDADADDDNDCDDDDCDEHYHGSRHHHK